MNKRKQILRAYNIVVVTFLVLGVGYALSRFVHLGSTEYSDNAMVHRHLSPSCNHLLSHVVAVGAQVFNGQGSQLKKGGFGCRERGKQNADGMSRKHLKI